MNPTDLIELAKANPMLVAGIGTVLVGSFMYVLKGIPLWCYHTVKRMLTIELSLTSQSALYHELLDVLSRHRVKLFARNFSTDGQGDIVSGFGRSIGIYKGRLVLFDRHLLEQNLRLSEKLDLTLFSRSVPLLQRLVEDAQRPVSDGHIKLYTSSVGGYWNGALKRRKRSLDTVFANASTKDTIVNKIRWFLANEEWYRRRGILYKLVFLLHGKPGTGKTSLVYGIASEFDRSLCSVSKGIGNADVLLANTPENSFVVIEDIDMLSVSRDEDAAPTPGAPVAPAVPQAEKQDDNDGFELSALHVLINALDGLGTPHGLILFITTNYRDRLDTALIRRGRVDCEMEIGALDRTETEAMFVAFYGEEARPLIQAYTQLAHFRPHTGADLQVLFMGESAERAVAALELRDESNVLELPHKRPEAERIHSAR